ncbi:MAG: hypothetical protein PUA97_04535 [bacterium]|nr:hypothetical protein [bacterium]
MSNKSRVILARVMIFCSVILISSGVYLNLQETKPIIDPVSDVTTPDNDSVIITTNDGMPPTATNDNDSDKTGNSDNATAVPNDSTSSDTPVPNNTTTSGNTGNTSSTGNTSGTNTNSTPSPSPAPEPEPEPAPVVDQNVIFRKSIEDTYGVKVFYGNETSDYSVGGMSTTVIPDSSISSALTQLNDALATYPVGFFQEFLNKNINVNVYLIKNYSANNVTGVTDTSFKRINISIAMDFPFNESFHHEVLHAIEYYIERSGGKFTSWNSFNPADFSYGTENKDYSYSVTGEASSYFVNNYAQVSQSEDRASTFEYMTASKRYSCFDSHGYPIWKKSDYLSRMIDTYFNTVTPEVIDYWERYVY